MAESLLSQAQKIVARTAELGCSIVNGKTRYAGDPENIARDVLRARELAQAAGIGADVIRFEFVYHLWSDCPRVVQRNGSGVDAIREIGSGQQSVSRGIDFVL